MLLRLVANAAVFVFYVSCFTVFLVGFNCNWFTKEGGTQRAVMDAVSAGGRACMKAWRKASWLRAAQGLRLSRC